LTQHVGASGVAGEFMPVSVAKFVKSPRIMTEPFPQGGRRRDLLQPQIERRRFLADATRPDTIDQNPLPIRRRWRIIDSLQLYLSHSSRLIPCHAAIRS